MSNDENSYNYHENKGHLTGVIFFDLGESTFVPQEVTRAALIIFGSQLATNDRIAGGLGVNKNNKYPNGINDKGVAEKVGGDSTCTALSDDYLIV